MVASWLAGSPNCRILVDAILVREDGTTQGRRCVDRVLNPTEWLEVTPHRKQHLECVQETGLARRSPLSIKTRNAFSIKDKRIEREIDPATRKAIQLVSIAA